MSSRFTSLYATHRTPTSTDFRRSRSPTWQIPRLRLRTHAGNTSGLTPVIHYRAVGSAVGEIDTRQVLSDHSDPIYQPASPQQHGLPRMALPSPAPIAIADSAALRGCGDRLSSYLRIPRPHTHGYHPLAEAARTEPDTSRAPADLFRRSADHSKGNRTLALSMVHRSAVSSLATGGSSGRARPPQLWLCSVRRPRRRRAVISLGSSHTARPYALHQASLRSVNGNPRTADLAL